jgi:two-component system phosphate regulon sensor histidine kinase PhoR
VALLVLLATGSGMASAIAGLGVIAGQAVASGIRGRAEAAGGPGSEAHAASARDPGPRAKLLESMLEGLHDPALVLDREANVISANAQARLLLPVVTQRHISHTCRSPELLAAIDRASAARGQQRGEARILGPLGHTLSLIVTPLAEAPAAGEPALLVVLRDLSDREQLTRLRADFVANASHELRTPLASLKGFLETIRGPARDDTAAREKFLGIMQEQADRMSRLIDDLLSLSRIEMRQHLPPEGTADLAEIARLVASSVAGLAAGQEICVVLEGATSAELVTGDRDELIQLVQNLVQNAVKYGRRGGKVEITIGRDGGRAVLSVADDGIGIAPEHLPRLTERFYRVSAKDSRERGGTGLGLAIAKHIVNRHQGELRIDSKPGVGSTFTVLLPGRASL